MRATALAASPHADTVAPLATLAGPLACLWRRPSERGNAAGLFVRQAQCMRWLAASYVVLLLVIVALADTGGLGGVVRVVHEVPMLDKLGHLVFAIGLGAALEGALPRGRALWIAVPIVIAEELSQLFVPGRTFDLLDLAADGIGLGIGTLLVVALRGLARSGTQSTRGPGCMRA